MNSFKHNGLGDYIHYTREKFLKYGIGRKSAFKIGSGEYTKAAMQLYADTKKYIGNKTIDTAQIEDALNHTLGKNNININKNEKFTYGDLQKIINDALEQVYSEFEFNPQTLEVSGKKIIDERISKRVKKAKKFHWVKTFEKTVTDLESIIKKTDEILKNSPKDKEILNLNSQANTLLNKLQDILKNNSYKNDEEKITARLVDAKIYGPNNHKISLSQKISQFISMASRTLAIQETGAASEYFSQAVFWALEGRSSKDIKELLDQLINKNLSHSGTTTINSFINTSVRYTDLNALKDDLKKTFRGIYEIGPNGATVSVSASYQTVDAEITVGELKDIRASIKSYSNLNKNIHIVSGASAAVILSLLNSQVANHYINLYVTQYDKEGAGAKAVAPLPFGAQDKELFTLATISRGLIGNRGEYAYQYKGARGANIMVVNDRSNQRFKVFTMEKIYDTIYRGNINNYILLSPDSIFNSGSINQTWVQGEHNMSNANQRISKIIAKLHQQKIDASLKPSVFK